MEAVAKRLKSLRESIHISQSKLAAIAGSTQASINRYENDQTDAPYKILLWYADYFDVSLDYIFGRTDEPQGKGYGYLPKETRERFADKHEWEQFIEACFEPGSPMNERLKMALAGMVEERE